MHAPDEKRSGVSVAVFCGRLGLRDVIVKVFGLLGCLKGLSRLHNEIKALKHLTAKKCQHALTYITDFVRDTNTLFCGIWSEHCVVMTKVPGRSLSTYTVQEIVEMRDKIQPAFEKAVTAVYACGIDNGSHHLGNVLWDSAGLKC